MSQSTVLPGLADIDTIDIEFNDIVYKVDGGLWRGERKEILRKIDGRFRNGQLSAIMGPSGSGKSSLLNVLTGFKRCCTGQIRYVGSKKVGEGCKKQCCYIQQDDQFYPLFTVSETMWIASNLKIGNNLNEKSKKILIEQILHVLDLSKSENTRCGKLSGGQKKRLSIALELIDNPPIMFLDEPTTGLDSQSCNQCVRLLRNLAKIGRTIVCTIHQPSAVIFEMFDYIYLLVDGRCMYRGATRDTIPYFASVGLHCPKYHNPADFMIEVVSKEYGNFDDQLIALAARREDEYWQTDAISRKEEGEGEEEEEEKVEEEEGCVKDMKKVASSRPPSEYEKLLVLMNRYMTHLFRDWTNIYLKLGLHFSMGVLLGLLYFGAGQDGSRSINNVGLIQVIVIYLCYTSMMPAVLLFPSEMPVLKKERFNNWYKLKTYYVASFVCSMPIQIIFSVIYILPIYFISYQPLDVNRFLMFLVPAILISLVSESVGVVIGSILNPVNGTFLGAILACSMLAFSGFVILFNHMPRIMYYVSYVSYIKYSLHAIVLAMYDFNREKLFCPITYCHYSTPGKILSELSMTDRDFWVDIAVLIFSYVIFKIAGYCTLKRTLTM
ncbi:ATP-binding cassette sub-family G member [Apis cerana cerana]|uniref:ATP-binding cassette sub-family G member n=1 Tax=Apis cerana cerana TaxID=94128 RepID=A0A2A3EN44_APICC|nr:ATP-binding cassette sub-family G member [Apis cerana cerana]